MKLPYVLLPRIVFDQMTKHLDDERERTRRLTKTIVQMKVAGGTVQRAALAGRLPPREVSDFDRDVDQAIESNRHSRRVGVAAQLRSFAERSLASGMPEKQILHRLKNWSKVGPARADEDGEGEEESDDVIAIVVDDGQEERTA